MERLFEQQLEVLSVTLQRMGGLVEQAIGRSVDALVNRDEALARQVIADDKEVDELELKVDRMIMEILARYQLAARDLRLVTTAMKIAPDLERIGDHAVNVSERVVDLLREPPLKPLVDVRLMAQRAQEMLRRALDAFVTNDAAAARSVILMDDELDDRMESVFRELLSHMIENPQTITRSIRLAFIAKYFERIGDQATNICEQVVYMVEGEVIKHPRITGMAHSGGEEE
jgi:phosphate transport system protein